MTTLKHSSWGQRALEHATALAQQGRGSATRAEAAAAEYACQQLAAAGVRQVRLQPFDGLRSLWLFLALAFGMALIGHAAFWLLSRPLGTLLAVIVALLAFAGSGYLLWCKFAYRPFPGRQALPRGTSQNVIAVLPAAAPSAQAEAPGPGPYRRVVLVGHLDSHRAVLWFAHSAAFAVYKVVTPLALVGVIAAPLCYALAGITGVMAFTWPALIFALLHFVAWFSGVTADLGPYSPGANDNASGVGTALALAERLQQAPLQHTEVWLALTGCEETGCEGMTALLDEYGDQLKDALFVDFEMVGIGRQLVYLQNEGMARKRVLSPDVESLVRQAGARYELLPLQAAWKGGTTEIGVAWERGYAGVCFLTLREQADLRATLAPPEWHRITDRPERLEVTALESIHALAWDLLQTIDQGIEPQMHTDKHRL